MLSTETPRQVTPAPYGLRLASVFIDAPVSLIITLSVFVGVMIVAAVMVFGSTAFSSGEDVALRSEEMGAAFADLYAPIVTNPWGYGLAAWVYYVPLWALYGSSVGKHLVGLKVVNLKGQHPTLRQAFIRYAVMAALGPLLGLPWWFILWRPDRRALHDLAAGTQIVPVERPLAATSSLQG